jgi:hypothetical protein
MKNLQSVFVGLSLGAGAVFSHAQIAQWDFDSFTLSSSNTNSTSLFGVPPEIGPLPESSASSVHATAATFSTQLGNGSPKSIQANGWSVGDYWQFQTSTIGITNIGVSWDQTGGVFGPRDFKLSYSLDGTIFTDWTSYSVLENGGGGTGGAWTTFPYRSVYFYSYNLSGITALNNASSVYFRLTVTSTTGIGGVTVMSFGTDRVDNFTIDTATVLTLKNPQRLANGQFQFLVHVGGGHVGVNYAVERSTDFSNWTALVTNHNSFGAVFVDTNAPSANFRFYRARQF